MSNLLADDKHQQIAAPGRLEWSLRRIEWAAGDAKPSICVDLPSQMDGQASALQPPWSSGA
jgi:hypothetical protein